MQEAQKPSRRTKANPAAKTLIETKDLRVWFPIRAGFMRKTVGHIKAVDGVTCEVRQGQTLGVVGESGSGKTTLGLAMLRLIRSEGPIAFLGQRIDAFKANDMRPLRRDMQIVFQDPYGSLSPRLSVAEIVEEGLTVQKSDLSYRQRREIVARTWTDGGSYVDAYRKGVGHDAWTPTYKDSQVMDWLFEQKKGK